MEKAIEIKRRAQRCILNGDLDGALGEYEKLIASGDKDPYYCVLVADLLIKKSMGPDAARRYFEAVDGYERQGLYKNAIAVCRKMSRLSIGSLDVLRRLGDLHRLDGLPTEAARSYVQHADQLMQQDHLDEARTSLQLAIETCPDHVMALERLGEVEVLTGKFRAAERAWNAAADLHERLGQSAEAKRWRNRAEQTGLKNPTAADGEAQAGMPAAAADSSVAGADAFDLFVTPAGIDRPVGAAGGAEAAADGPAPAVAGEHAGADAAAPAMDPGLMLAGFEPGAYDPGEGVESPAAESVEPAAATEPSPAALEDEAAPERSPLLIQRLGEQDTARVQPGLDFAGAVAERVSSPQPQPAAESDPGMAAIGALLLEAQAFFGKGDRSGAASALVRAAQAYDQLELYESAAAIYRSLGHSTDSSLQLMMLWLKNCQRRDDRREAARVACDLGDRSLNDGDTPGAREWFERARAYDPENELATRRLRLLDGGGDVGTGAAPEDPTAARPELAAPAGSMPQTSAPGVAAAGAHACLNVRLDQADPAAIDLGILIAEFQRGVGAQLASDPQGHYDLGMSYREMGLLEPAVESFHVAAQDPAFFLRAKEMAGRCLLDLGQFDVAADELRAALGAPDLRPIVAHDLRYQLGLALEAAGQLREALDEFERVYSVQANYPDVAMKIRVLRKTLESC